MLRAAIYARVSKQEQATPGSVSLDQQIAECRRLAVDRGYQVVLIEWDVLTGLVPQRPGYQRVLEAARSGAVEVILSWKWDRWGRDAGESITAYGELTRLGVLVDSVMEQGSDDFTQGLHSLMAKKASQDTSQRVNLSFRARAARGDWLWSRAPFGYRRVRIAGRPTLEPDPATAPELRAIYADALTGRYSLYAMVRCAYGRGVFAPDGRTLDRGTILRMLRNPAYRGAVVYGRQSLSRFARRKGQQAPETWVVCEDAHPALVSLADWQRVQEWLDLHRREQGTVRGTPYLLTSLTWCGLCGTKVYGRPYKRGYTGYFCRRHALQQACGLKTVHGPTIESAVKARVSAAFALTDAMREGAAALLAEESDREAAALDRRRQQLQRQRQGHEEQRRSLARRLLGGIIPEEVYRDLEGEEVGALRLLDRELAALPVVVPTAQLQRRLAFVAAVDWGSLDAAGWRELLLVLVQRVTVRGPRDFDIEYWPEAETLRRAVATLLH